jgi:TatD DNase family protein
VNDAHTHLDRTPGEDAENLAAARAAGVRRVLTIGMGPDGCAIAQAQAEAHDDVFFAAGHHPNMADDYAGGLEPFAAHPKCRAIGETGLDHFRDYADPEHQRTAFHAQIDLARETRKPLVIHTRAADDETIATLTERASGLEVILHCFSMADRLDECLANGWWISFAGNVTYPNAQDLADAAARTPLDRILVETDAPYLTPQPVRKHRNRSAYVTYTADFIAERRGIAYAELEEAVEANAATLFGW